MSVKVIRDISGFGGMFIEIETVWVATAEEMDNKASKSTLTEVEKRLNQELALVKAEAEHAYELAKSTQKQLQSVRGELSESIRKWKDQLDQVKTEAVTAFRDVLQDDAFYDKYEQMISDHLARIDRELYATLEGFSTRQEEVNQIFSDMDGLIEEFKRLHELRKIEERATQEYLDRRIGVAVADGQAAWRWVRKVQSLGLFERFLWVLTGRLPSDASRKDR